MGGARFGPADAGLDRPGTSRGGEKSVGTADYIALVIIGLLAAAALRSLHRRSRKQAGGCCAGCTGCTGVQQNSACDLKNGEIKRQ